MSTRTLEGRHAFQPADHAFSRLAWGIVGRAQTRYGVDVAGFVLLGDHYHALVRAKRRAALSSFMQYLNAQLATLTHDYYGTRGKVWARRFSSTCLLDDEAETYWFDAIVSHGVKERICEDPRKWTGANSAESLCSGRPPRAAWLDRRAWVAAGRPQRRGPFLRSVNVRLTPLTAFEGGPPRVYRAWCRGRVESVVVRYAEQTFVGVDVAVARGPDYRTEPLKWSRCRCFDARGEGRAALLRDAYAARRVGTNALAGLRSRLIRAGHAAIRPPDASPPAGFDWAPLFLDALEDRPIVAEFPRGRQEHLEAVVSSV